MQTWEWQAEAVIQEDSPQRRAAARRAAQRPLAPGDHLEIYAVEVNQFGGSTWVAIRRPVYDVVGGYQVGWQCWRVPFINYSFHQLC